MLDLFSVNMAGDETSPIYLVDVVYAIDNDTLKMDHP
jgi:hypothetical protein